MANLLESELIINPDGSIYHLNLLPQDVAGIVILVGDPQRVEQVSKYFDRIEIRKMHREFITHTGYIGSKRITVISSGIGTDNIDIVMNELDALVNIDFGKREIKENKTGLNIVRIGTTGLMQPDVEIDSILVSTHGLGLDLVMNFYNIDRNRDLEASIKQQLGYDFLSPYFFPASTYLLDKFEGKFLRGITASCCGFYGPQGRVLRADTLTTEIIKRCAELSINGMRVVNFEMETSAIYGFAQLFGHHALSVNAVIANRVNNTFSVHPEKTVDRTIRETLEILATL